MVFSNTHDVSSNIFPPALLSGQQPVFRNIHNSKKKIIIIITTEQQRIPQNTTDF